MFPFSSISMPLVGVGAVVCPGSFVTGSLPGVAVAGSRVAFVGAVVGVISGPAVSVLVPEGSSVTEGVSVPAGMAVSAGVSVFIGSPVSAGSAVAVGPSVMTGPAVAEASAVAAGSAVAEVSSVTAGSTVSVPGSVFEGFEVMCVSGVCFWAGFGVASAGCSTCDVHADMTRTGTTRHTIKIKTFLKNDFFITIIYLAAGMLCPPCFLLYKTIRQISTFFAKKRFF